MTLVTFDNYARSYVIPVKAIYHVTHLFNKIYRTLNLKITAKTLISQWHVVCAVIHRSANKK